VRGTFIQLKDIILTYIHPTNKKEINKKMCLGQASCYVHPMRKCFFGMVEKAKSEEKKREVVFDQKRKGRVGKSC